MRNPSSRWPIARDQKLRARDANIQACSRAVRRSYTVLFARWSSEYDVGPVHMPTGSVLSCITNSTKAACLSSIHKQLHEPSLTQLVMPDEWLQTLPSPEQQVPMSVSEMLRHQFPVLQFIQACACSCSSRTKLEVLLPKPPVPKASSFAVQDIPLQYCCCSSAFVCAKALTPVKNSGLIDVGKCCDTLRKRAEAGPGGPSMDWSTRGPVCRALTGVREAKLDG